MNPEDYSPEKGAKKRFASFRKNNDPMVDKKRNTAEHHQGGFYWVPICFSFFPAFFAFAFALPLFPKSPQMFILDEIPLSSFSGYELMFLSPISATFFGLTIASWAYLTFVGIFTALRSDFREVAKMNALLSPALGLLAVCTTGALISMVVYVSGFDHSKIAPYTPFDFVEVTYWALLIVPYLLVVWWVAVNISNVRLQKKAKEAPSGLGESLERESEREAGDRQQE